MKNYNQKILFFYFIKEYSKDNIYTNNFILNKIINIIYSLFYFFRIFNKLVYDLHESTH